MQFLKLFKNPSQRRTTVIQLIQVNKYHPLIDVSLV